MPATADDNARILAFQASHRMAGKLALRFDRSPDFSALYRCHSPTFATWLAQDEGGAIKGLASYVVRPGYVEGRVEPVAYLGDLRVVPDRRLSRDWNAALRERLLANERDFGVRHSYGCVIRDNTLARRALVSSRRRDRLALAHWRGYGNVSILGSRPFIRVPTVDGVRVMRATQAQADALGAFLDLQSRAQSFGCVFDREMFARRLREWPSFGISSFWIALDRADRIVGCVAPWDPGAVKRVVIERLPPAMQVLRRAFNACAPLLGRPRIAAPGAALADVYLTHVQVERRDTRVFALLLAAAWDDVRGRYPTLSLCLYDGDPLWPALRAYWSVSIAMDLYTVTAGPHVPPLDTSAETLPGFEIYLV